MTDVADNLSVNTSYRTAGNTAPGVMNVYIPAGWSGGNGLYLQSTGSAGGDLPFLAWRNSNQSVLMTIWTDMASGHARIKSQGSLNFHTQNVDFNTGTNARMTITGTGNVGIGTPAPGELLDVEGGNNPAIRVTSTSSNNPAFKLVSAAKTGKLEVQGAEVMLLSYEANKPIQFQTGSTTRMTITGGDQNLQGRVGIGTTTPSDLLHVLSGTNGRVILQSTGSGNLSYELMTNGATAKFGIENFSPTDGRIYLGHDASWPIELRIAGQAPVTVRQSRVEIAGALYTSGNVGIGVSSPAVKLDVDGEIRTTKPIRAAGSGADGMIYGSGFNVIGVKDVIDSAGKVYGAVYG